MNTHPPMDTISTDITGFGPVSVTESALDLAIARYLPASISGLRAIAAERFPDIGTLKYAGLTQLLMVIADSDYNVGVDGLFAVRDTDLYLSNRVSA